jgi:3-isopropylmalate/(R)-2-methylmalate dehydratase large subunit
MSQTVAQKILAKHCGRLRVEPGELIHPEFDLKIIHEVPLLELWRELEKIGLKRIIDPERLLVISDHEIPVSSLRAAERQKATRELMDRQGITNFIPPGRHGIQHQFAVQQGYAVPGQLVAVMDTHALNFGAVGCMAIPFLYEFSTIMGINTVWIRVPETIRVHVKGKLAPGVRVRDLAFHIISTIGPKNGDYHCIEYCGPAMAHLNVNDRMILCGVSVEIGAKTSLIEPDEVTLEYVKERAKFPYESVFNDPDAHFEKQYFFDASEVEAMVALPPSPDKVVPVTSLAGKKITSAYIGSCQSGTIEELSDAAAILKNHHVHPSVDLLIVPSTQEAFAQAARMGLIETFINAGAHVIGPTCGPCFGGLFTMADGDVRICTATRNDRGRMGSANSEIYLASALTVASSATKGEITDSRKLLPDNL